MKRVIDVIGVPFSLGGKKRGSQYGPDVLVHHGILSCIRSLGYQVSYQSCVNVSESQCTQHVMGVNINFLNAVESMTKSAGARVFASHRVGNFPIVIGGDHSVSLGTLPQFLDPAISHERKVGLLWVDAHYDAHTEDTTTSHFANGLPFAYALGSGETSLACHTSCDNNIIGKIRLRFMSEFVLHIGAGKTDCEEEEILLLQSLGVRNISMKDMYDNGEEIFITQLEKLLRDIDDLIVTFDLDVMHRNFVPAVSFQSEHGMNPTQAFIIADMVRDSTKLRQLEIMEYNPDYEVYDQKKPISATFIMNFLDHILGKI